MKERKSPGGRNLQSQCEAKSVRKVCAVILAKSTKNSVFPLLCKCSKLYMDSINTPYFLMEFDAGLKLLICSKGHRSSSRPGADEIRNSRVDI